MLASDWCSVAHVGDLGKLSSLESYDADWNAADYTGRSVDNR